MSLPEKKAENRQSRTVLVAFFVCVWFALLGCAYQSTQEGYGYNEDQDSFAFLDAYGGWIYVANYGKVWRPDVPEYWEPFQFGYWGYTDDGWTWISYEPFGWMVCHYGYWAYQQDVGWFWIPGYTWSPARVRWFYFDDYVGWAPLPPPGAFLPDPWEEREFRVWNFVRMQDFRRDDVDRFIVRSMPGERRSGRARGFERPPDVRDVEKYSHEPVRKIRGQRETVTVGGRQFQKLLLPREERERIRPYEEHFRQETMRRAPERQRAPEQTRPEQKKEGVEQQPAPERQKEAGTQQGQPGPKKEAPAQQPGVERAKRKPNPGEHPKSQEETKSREVKKPTPEKENAQQTQKPEQEKQNRQRERSPEPEKKKEKPKP